MSLQQKLRAFASIQLGNLIPWESFRFPDTSHSDTSRCVIEGKNGTYRLSVTSSYAHPPLGWIVFKDGDHEITGANQDAAWHEIAVYLKAKEGGEQPAEPKPIKSVAPLVADESVVIPLQYDALGIPDRCFVYYFAEPGAWYQNGPALVTRINRDGSYQLTVFPEGSDPIFRANVQRRSEKLRHVCWDEYQAKAAEITVNRFEVDNAQLREEIAELRVQVADLMQRRGRQPKDAA